MKILAFEFSSIIYRDNIISEGSNMLKSILSDLNDIEEYAVYYLINKDLIFAEFNNCHAIVLNEPLYKWLDNNCSKFDCCIFIAPEDNLIQYKITKILEQHKIINIGSKSSASYICSSKDRTYKQLPENILKIPSIKIDVNNIDYDNIKSKMDLNNRIIKPDNKTSSDLIYAINNVNDLKKIIEKYKKESVNTALIQEYIKGTAISTSMLCSKDYIRCISINSQEISHKNNQITYLGCKTPIKHPLKDKIIETSTNIIDNITGLQGFIGIDYIIKNNEIYFVEINSRITTPYIILHNITNINLTQTIIELVLYSRKRNIILNDKGKFFK